MSYIDENNNPVPIFGSNAFKHLKFFDRFGRLIEERYLDAKDKPVNLRGLEGMAEQGISRKLIQYKDDYINRVEYFDMSGNKVFYDLQLNKTFPMSELLEKKEIIYLDSNPRGAKIYVDDQLIGITPLKRDPEKETFKYKLIKKGAYLEYEGFYDVSTRGKIIDLQIDTTYQDPIDINSVSKDELYRLASLDQPRALTRLGIDLILGNEEIGIEKDLKKGFKYLSKASDLNDPIGVLMLGKYYKNFEENEELAFFNFTKSCNLGALNGCYLAGSTLEDYKRMDLAINFYQLASDLGDPMAAWGLSHIFSNPDKGYKNIGKALSFAHRFWELKQSKESARTLGDLYDQIGDYESANKWYKTFERINNDATYLAPTYLESFTRSKGRSTSLGQYVHGYVQYISSTQNAHSISVKVIADHVRRKMETTRSY